MFTFDVECKRERQKNQRYKTHDNLTCDSRKYIQTNPLIQDIMYVKYISLLSFGYIHIYKTVLLLVPRL